MEEREGATATPAVSPTPVENGESRKQVAGERGEEKPSQGGEVAASASASASASALALALASAPAPAAAAEVVAAAALGMKKKRGRPRKYGPDGKLVRPLNPSPISASMPLGEYTPATAVGAVMKRGRGWLMGFGLGKPLQYGFQLESVGITADFPIYSLISASNFSSLFFFLLKFFAFANFTPHVLTVAAGEDVTMKIMSFSQMGPRAICILSANGVISSVTLRQSDSFGGTLTYEGHFQLLSLSGSFMPTENGGTKSRSGGMSVSLASPDGRVVGGGVAGLLVAASPVQVVVGSFLPSYHLEQKIKKTKLENSSISTPTATIPISSTATEGAHCGGGPTHCSLMTPELNLTNATSFKGDNCAAPLHSVPDTRDSATNVGITSPGN
ncbi:hypothetical protein B296_00028865 [Ensete ventricosum]|uniref:AT-hook motif nuclear-localized protein n=1 Tax=Ensete ventricosum TaxID=4639 RepID=A0A427A0D0_ENSVE|nr:hypothetical protein B296_00028865 [Ensete ventricosum]